MAGSLRHRRTTWQRMMIRSGSLSTETGRLRLLACRLLYWVARRMLPRSCFIAASRARCGWDSATVRWGCVRTATLCKIPSRRSRSLGMRLLPVEAATAFDAEREELVIFGGEGAGGALGTPTFSAETGFVRRD